MHAEKYRDIRRHRRNANFDVWRVEVTWFCRDQHVAPLSGFGMDMIGNDWGYKAMSPLLSRLYLHDIPAGFNLVGVWERYIMHRKDLRKISQKISVGEGLIL
jgi:hypothetical protein